LKLKINIRKVIKWVLAFFLTVLFLAIVLIFSLTIPSVQNFVKDRLIVYLKDKIKTEISLERLYISFPNSITVEKIYLQGQDRDTLLFINKLDVSINILGLIYSKADIASVNAEGIRANIVRNGAGDFNFNYIIEAFSSPPQKDKKPSKPFEINLRKIDLKDITIAYNDSLTGNNLNLYFNSLNTNIKQSDLIGNNFAVDDIFLNGLKLNFEQWQAEEKTNESVEKIGSSQESKPLNIALKGLYFTDFDINYVNKINKTYVSVLFKELSTKIRLLDLSSNSFEIDSILLSEADVKAKLFIPTDKPQSKKADDNPKTDNKALKFLLNSLKLNDVNIAYDNLAAAYIEKGMDFNHLNFSGLELDLSNFKMEDNAFSGKVNSVEVTEKSGFDLQKFKTVFVYSGKEVYLKDLLLQTSNTLLRNEIVLNYSSIRQLLHNTGDVWVSVNLQGSRIGFADILNLVPQLVNTAPFSKYPTGTLITDVNLKGRLNDLSINRFTLSGPDNLTLNINGAIRNALLPDSLYFDLNIEDLSAGAELLANLLPENTVPSNITIPDSFSISGQTKGTMKELKAYFDFQSSLGAAILIADVDMNRKNEEIYELKADLNNLELGKIIQNNEIGPLSLVLETKGESFDINKTNSEINTIISAATYKGYTYQGVILKGNINRGEYKLDLQSNDSNANMKLVVSGIYDNINPTVKLDADIIKVDLNRINLYGSPMTIAGNLGADFKTLDPDSLNADLLLKDFTFQDSVGLYKLQDIDFNAFKEGDSARIVFGSQILDLELAGNYKLTEIFTYLSQTLNGYYQFQKPDTLTEKRPEQNFALNAVLKDDELIRKFLPELKGFDTISLSSKYNSDNESFELNCYLPQTEFGSNSIDSVLIKLDNQKGTLSYSLNIDSIKNPNLFLNKIALKGDVVDNKISYNFNLKDELDSIRFMIAGTANSMGELFEISLLPNGLRFDYEDWKIDPTNKIQIGKAGILADNFKLRAGEGEISLQSVDKNPNSDLIVTLKNFKIETITELLSKDTVLASGTINGSASIADLIGNMTFNSDLNITDLFVFENQVGDISLKASKTTADNISADIAISGNNNDLNISAGYNLKDAVFDIILMIDSLQLKTVEAFAKDEINGAEGYLSGSLKVKGSAENPKVSGALKFNDVGLLLTQTGSEFKNINDQIEFTEKGIVFDQFKVKDNEGNTLFIDGQVLTSAYRDFAFNLDVNTKDFKAVNSKKSADALMYGILSIDAALRIRGDLNLPKVDGNIAVTEKTDFVFVLPQTNATIEQRDGIVEFVKFDEPLAVDSIGVDTISTESKIKGTDISVNIEINRDAKMTIVIDKTNGDIVKLQGEAVLTGGVDPSGKITLAGVYEIEKGSYEMSLSLLKRKFDLQKGSSITWSGDPADAKLDFTAVYRNETAPIDLVEQQITDASTLNQFRQKIPFNILLIMKGELLKPELSFDIRLDEKNSKVSSTVTDMVETKLAYLRTQETEMNKQVFALLLLNRFVGENPFESGGGVSAETMAKQSVSKILSQQLNNLASGLIKGVDLNFNLETMDEYSSGEKNTRTDLNVDISKRLMNDRLKVSIGSSFGLDGEARENENMTNIAGDVTLDYNLSKDGRYMLRTYRKNEYQVALQGQIVETGLGFIITLDYDNFLEIFQKSKKKGTNNKR
jgi:hypothetical protein